MAQSKTLRARRRAHAGRKARTLIATRRGKLGLLRKIGAAPNIKCDERMSPGSHGVRLIACVVDQRPGWPRAPRLHALLPVGSAGKRQVDLLRFMVMARIERARSKEQKAAGNARACQRTARAGYLRPAVVIQKGGVDFRCRITLPPEEYRRCACERGKELRTEARRIACRVREPTQNWQPRCFSGAQFFFSRPLIQNRSERRRVERDQKGVSVRNESPDEFLRGGCVHRGPLQGRPV
jgi:hypothetical protein